MLADHWIRLLIDVRRWPASRRYPQFNREPLAAALKESGIAYLWRGDRGGIRKPQPGSVNAGWRVAASHADGDCMATAAFERIAKEIKTRGTVARRAHVRGGGTLALPPPVARRCVPGTRLDRAAYHG